MPRKPIIQAGRKAPDFELPAIGADGEAGTVKLSEYRGRKVVIFFYPKDSTPACTQESCDFRDATARLNEESLNTTIVGISTNDLKSHRKFADKYELHYPLLADVDHKVCEIYGVWQEKQLYGRAYMGIVRSTFLIDENGKLLKEWRNLRVKGHVDEVVDAIRGLRKRKRSASGRLDAAKAAKL